jgi:dolichyl-phosphate beta-glucosyltransferase
MRRVIKQDGSRMNETAQPRLSVVIPAYNEEARLGATLEKMKTYFARVDYAAEVLVVDDGSRDRTAEVARAHAGQGLALQVLGYGGNQGKGYAVRHGMMRARGEIRLFYDADGSTPIDQVEKFWPRFAEGATVCIGSRNLPDSDVVVKQPWHRLVMGRVFNGLVRLLAAPGFRDTQCGFKGFTAAAADAIFPRQRLTRFGFDVELLYLARRLGLRTVETPVQWIDSPSSRVSPLRDATQMFLEVLKIRWLALKGSYD